MAKKFFFDGINEGVSQRKPFFLATPGQLDDFQLQNYGPQVLEHLDHFSSPGSTKIRRFFNSPNAQNLSNFSEENPEFIHIFLDWDHRYPGKKLLNSFPDFCFST